MTTTGPTHTILIADDSPIICSIVKAFLEGHPFEILEAEDGERALRLLRLVSVDLAIIDVNMPGMDGIALLVAIRERDKTRKLPVVLLTGDTSHELDIRARAAGASGFLHKPITAETLLAEIARLLPGANT